MPKARTAGGCCKTATAARPTSSLNGSEPPAAGTLCARCGSSIGGRAEQRNGRVRRAKSFFKLRKVLPRRNAKNTQKGAFYLCVLCVLLRLSFFDCGYAALIFLLLLLVLVLVLGWAFFDYEDDDEDDLAGLCARFSGRATPARR